MYQIKYSFFKSVTLLFSVTLLSLSCANRNANSENTQNQQNNINKIDVWLTKADQSIKLQKQSSILNFSSQNNNYQNIEIDATQKFQSIDGFGYTLTGGSAQVINQLSATKKQELLQELFGNSENSISVSFLRISIGASDLNSSVFSYDDLPSGETDINLSQFSLSKDQELINLLKEILTINPNIKIIATPWSSPVWMKDNHSSIGGSLKPEYYSVYAQYFVKYITAMKQQGINITAITPQNEPLNPNNNPSLYMTAVQQNNFIKNHLGPAFQTANISTKIVVYDHNCDVPSYATDILSDPITNPFVDGSAFHLYAGDISVLSSVHNSFPTKNLYFTEQWTGSTGTFSGDFLWHIKNVVIGSTRNWSKIALEWNLANDAQFKPYTDGGCTQCKGAITINSSENFTRNVGYYIIAHASKFIPQNSVRISSTQLGNLNNVAFQTPSGKIALIVENDGTSSQIFNIKINGKWATTSLEGGSVATYIF